MGSSQPSESFQNLWPLSRRPFVIFARRGQHRAGVALDLAGISHPENTTAFQHMGLMGDGAFPQHPKVYRPSSGAL